MGGESSDCASQLLRASADSVLQQIAGNLRVTRWLNVEVSNVQKRRVDLLGATTGDDLVHIELQSSNDPQMALRMAEYSLFICRQFGRLPNQIVLYTGEPRLRMSTGFSGPDSVRPDFVFRYTATDFRDLESKPFLESTRIEDNLLAILTRLQNQSAAVRQILKRIATLDQNARSAMFAQFLIISGLRRLGPVIEEEARTMPVLNDILEHEVLGPAILQGRREGRREGRQELLLRQIEKRFGPLPSWVESRLVSLSSPELEDAALRLLDAASLEEVFS